MSNQPPINSGKNSAHRHFLRLKNHPFIVPVVTFLVLFFVSIVAFINFSATTLGPADTRVVHVYVDDQTQTLTTRAATVQELLQKLNVKVNQGDIVEPGLDAKILEDDFNINVYRSRPITVVDGKNRVSKFSAKQSVTAIARDAGIKLFPEDKVAASVNDDLLGEGVGETFVISRSIPMKLVLYGQSFEIRTHAKTVGEVLQEKDIKAEDVTTFPVATTPLKPNAVVFVTYEGRTIKSKSVSIPNKTEQVEDADLEFGATEVREAGRKGKKLVLYEVDPATKKRKVLQEVVAYKAVNRVVARGTKAVAGAVTGSKADWMRQAGIDSSQYPYVDLIIGRESGWNPGAVSANRCIGLGQRCNAQILVSACPNWQNDPVCQLRHFSDYANGRYGSWQNANAFWQSNHWW